MRFRRDFSDDIDDYLPDYEEPYMSSGIALPLRLAIPKRYEPSTVEEFEELFNDFDFQITYKFPKSFRNNKTPNGKYGSDNMTYRRLFEILCAMTGSNFVDDYLNNVLPYNALGEELKEYTESAKSALEDEFRESIRVTKGGQIDRRYLKRLSEFRSIEKEALTNDSSYLASRIKGDIIEALRDGRIPVCQRTHSPSTIIKRTNLGLNPLRWLYATGDTIRHIQFYLRLERKEAV